MSASKWHDNIIDLGLVGYGPSVVARLPDIFLGQFYLTNEVYIAGSTHYATAVRPPLPSGLPVYTEISLDVTGKGHFPYGFTVEPDVP